MLPSVTFIKKVLIGGLVSQSFLLGTGYSSMSVQGLEPGHSQGAYPSIMSSLMEECNRVLNSTVGNREKEEQFKTIHKKYLRFLLKDTEASAFVPDQMKADLLVHLYSWTQVGTRVGAQMRSAIRSQVSDQVWNQIGTRAGDQVWGLVKSHAGVQIRAEFMDLALGKFRDLGDPEGAHMLDQVWLRVRDLFEGQVGGQVDVQVRDQIRTFLSGMDIPAKLRQGTLEGSINPLITYCTTIYHLASIEMRFSSDADDLKKDYAPKLSPFMSQEKIDSTVLAIKNFWQGQTGHSVIDAELKFLTEG